MNFATLKQCDPIRGGNRVLDSIGSFIGDQVIHMDFVIRGLQGEAKYGMPLSTRDGRCGIVDAYQEAIDGTKYLYKSMLESTDSEDILLFAELARKQLDIAIRIREYLYTKGATNVPSRQNAKDNGNYKAV